MGSKLSKKSQACFIVEFNSEDSKYRKVLQEFVMGYFNEITTDNLNENSISFLLADLNRRGAATSYEGHLLGNIATERFITERILPMLHDAQVPLSQNIQAILKQAGSRHGRRYITE